MKKLLLSVALFSFVGLGTISATPCEDGKNCDKKECTTKKSKACAKKSKACCAKSSKKKSCHSAKAKSTDTKKTEE